MIERLPECRHRSASTGQVPQEHADRGLHSGKPFAPGLRRFGHPRLCCDGSNSSISAVAWGAGCFSWIGAAEGHLGMEDCRAEVGSGARDQGIRLACVGVNRPVRTRMPGGAVSGPVTTPPTRSCLPDDWLAGLPRPSFSEVWIYKVQQKSRGAFHSIKSWFSFVDTL